MQQSDLNTDHHQSIPQHIITAFNKIRQGESATWDKDELLDVIYWWRQLIGIAMGLMWGISQFTGLVALFLFFLTNIAVTVGLYKSLLGVDEEDFGGHGDLMSEGMPSCFASFMLTWVLSYTAFYT